MMVSRCPENRRNSSPSYFEAFTIGSSNDVKPWLRDCKLTFILFFRFVDYIIIYIPIVVRASDDLTRHDQTMVAAGVLYLFLLVSIPTFAVWKYMFGLLTPLSNPFYWWILVTYPHYSKLLGNHTDCLPKSPQRLFNFPHGLHQVVRAHRLLRQGQGQPGVVETYGDMIFVQCCSNLRYCNLQHPAALR